MEEVKNEEVAVSETPEQVSEITFEGVLPKVNFDDNKEELPFQFKLNDAEDQLKNLADLTDDPKGVLETMKSLLNHNGKLEIRIEKKSMRGIYYDASNPEGEKVVVTEGVTPIKVVLQSFIIDKKYKASVFYKGPKDLAQHKILAQHAGHKLKLSLSLTQGEMFEVN